jgi:hypothetical protein
MNLVVKHILKHLRSTVPLPDGYFWETDEHFPSLELEEINFPEKSYVTLILFEKSGEVKIRPFEGKLVTHSLSDPNFLQEIAKTIEPIVRKLPPVQPRFAGFVI